MKLLQSARFQALVVFAVVSYVAALGYISDSVLAMFATVILGAVGIRTVDRFGEKVGNK